MRCRNDARPQPPQIMLGLGYSQIVLFFDVAIASANRSAREPRSASSGAGSGELSPELRTSSTRIMRGRRDIFLRVEGWCSFEVASRQRDVPKTCEFKGGVGAPGGRRLHDEEMVVARMLSASVKSGQSAVSPRVTSAQPCRRDKRAIVDIGGSFRTADRQRRRTLQKRRGPL